MRRVLYYKIIFIFEFIECASWHIPTITNHETQIL